MDVRTVKDLCQRLDEIGDGRYVAAHIEGLSQPQTPTAAELPAKSVAHLEEMWAQITRGLKR